MMAFQGLTTPTVLASRRGRAIVPIFLLLGLLLGVVARGWMRFITTDPEFSWTGTLIIIGSFGLFATMQSLAALAAERSWGIWLRRSTRGLGLVSLLPLFGGAGALMAPFVVTSGLSIWQSTWNRAIRGVLGVLALADLAAVIYTIVSDHGLSLRSLLGSAGLVLIYGCVVWASEATFSPAPRSV